jgi:hypothetical protein
MWYRGVREFAPKKSARSLEAMARAGYGQAKFD